MFNNKTKINLSGIMAFIKRIFLFLTINLIIISTISFIISIFNLQPYLSSFGAKYSSLMIFCLLWGMLGAIISLLLSKKLAIWMMKVKIISSFSNETEKKLYNQIQKLSKQANLKHAPEIGVYQSNEVNAFATGPSQKKSLVAVSSGLLDRLNEKEINGVLAHEISHISNGDMVTMTLLQGIINAFVMFLARILAYAISFSSKEKNRSGSYFTYMMLVFLFQSIFMIFGSMIIFAFSRKREYKADIGGASLAGKESMIDALKALKNLKNIKSNTKQVAAIQALKISNKTKKGIFYHLFSSHPELDDRIKRLEQL